MNPSEKRTDQYELHLCSGSEAGSYLRLIYSCITQLKAQGPSRTFNESKEEARPICHWDRQHSEGDQFAFFKSLVCTGIRRYVVRIKTMGKEDLIPL